MRKTAVTANVLASLFCFAAAANATVTCPQNITVQILPGTCSIVFDYLNLEWSSSNPVLDTTFVPAPGSIFSIGTTPVAMYIIDNQGVLSTCTFAITVVENNNSLACLPTAFVSLAGGCERGLTLAEVLSPEADFCPATFELSRLNADGETGAPIISSEDLAAPVTFFVQNLNTDSICQVEVHVMGGAPVSIVCPANRVQFCNEPLDSSYTGSPEIVGCYEEISLAFMDELETTNCPDSFAFQIVRTWTGTDPFGNESTCLQFITGRKFNAALVQFPPDHTGVNSIPCSDEVPWQVLSHPDTTGYPVFGGFYAAASPFCKLNITYNDQYLFGGAGGCANTVTIRRAWRVVKTCPPFLTYLDTQIIQVADLLPPVFQIPDSIFVSLASDCADSIVNLPAANILFECSEFEITITTPWDTLSTNGGETQVELVAGNYPVTYRLEDECGNVSQQTAVLAMRNETLVVCPPNDTVFCDYYFDTLAVGLFTQNPAVLAQIGMPIFYANCDFETVEVDSFGVNSCGVGSVRRTISTVNAAELITCVQWVTVLHESDFEVEFPANISICGEPESSVTGEPTLYGVNCEAIQTNYEDVIVGATMPGTCYTIHRTWNVRNTCFFNPDNSLLPDLETGERRFTDGGDGYLEYVQIIEVNQAAVPVFSSGCVIPNAYVSPNLCTASVTLPPASATGCSIASMSVSGDLGTIVGQKKNLQPGNYDVTYLAVDSCGNEGTCTAIFTVRDTVPPLAVCTSAVVTILPGAAPGLPPAGEIMAQNLIAVVIDNCPAQGAYSFSPIASQPFTVFTCSDIGTDSLTIYVKDGSGNQTSCKAEVTVVAVSPNPCSSGAPITGFIETEEDEPVAQVTVQFSNNSELLTENDGMYSYEPPFPNSLNITPVKNINPANGVTTFDLVLLTKHILGVQPLSSPYLQMAADVNNSGTVTTFDAVAIRQLILGVTTSFPNVPSWRFVPESFQFPDPQNPFSSNVPGSITVTQPLSGNENFDFIGIKMGDLNLNADPGQ